MSDKYYYEGLIKTNNKYILAESHNNYATLLIKENDFKKAREHLEIAKKVNPNLKEVYYNLALISYLKRNYSEALKLIEECHNKGVFNELNDSLRLLYICCCLHQEEMIEKGLDLSKNFNNSFINSYLFAKNKQYKKSIKELKSILRSANIAEYMMNGENFSNNIEYWEERDFGYSMIAYKHMLYSDLAFVEYSKQDYKKALEYIQKAKKYSFDKNDIDIYAKNIHLENIILSKQKSEQE